MPLFYTIAALLLDAKMSRYFEKQADLVAATALNNAADGATAFAIVKRYRENAPLPLLRRIKDYIPLFRSHPTLEERISYLSALAIQQQAQSISA